MRKAIAVLAVCLLGLLLGPAIIFDLVTDYSYAAEKYLGSRKPTQARIHEAERKINKGTEAVAELKVALRRMERERERIEGLLARAPLPPAEMRQQHEALKTLTTEARRTGQRVEYNGRASTPDEMETVLARQRTELEKYERYAQRIEDIEEMKNRTQATIGQALDERETAKTELEYARSLTRIAEATAVTKAPFEARVGEFREAEEALEGIIALQEVRLGTTERTSAFAGEGRLVPAGG